MQAKFLNLLSVQAHAESAARWWADQPILITLHMQSLQTAVPEDLKQKQTKQSSWLNRFEPLPQLSREAVSAMTSVACEKGDARQAFSGDNF